MYTYIYIYIYIYIYKYIAGAPAAQGPCAEQAPTSTCTE